MKCVCVCDSLKMLLAKKLDLLYLLSKEDIPTRVEIGFFQTKFGKSKLIKSELETAFCP